MTATQPVQTAVRPSPTSLLWWRCRSELIVVAGLVALALYLAVGIAAMEVPEGAATPGPQFFPTIVVGFLAVLAVALTIDVLRNPRHPGGNTDTPAEVSGAMLHDIGDLEDTGEIGIVRPGTRPDDDGRAPIDWRTVSLVFGGLVLFAVALQPIGWLIAATALFWIVCHALGSRRPVFDIAIAVIFASLVQLAFSAGLGLTLPGGLFEGVGPWSN